MTEKSVPLTEGVREADMETGKGRQAVILIGHGSRAAGANDDMERIAERLRAITGQTVEVCPLEGQGVRFADSVAHCVAEGANPIIVLPYFLHFGVHLRQDVPEMLRAAAVRHPGVHLVLGKHLGFDDALALLAAKRLKESEGLEDIRGQENVPVDRRPASREEPVHEGQDRQETPREPVIITMEKKKILIVGCGPGSEAYITPVARAAALTADVLIVSPRLERLFPESAAERIDSGNDVEGTLEVMAKRRDRGQQVCLLATGDPGIASLAQPVIRYFGREQCVVYPGISSIQVAFARIGLSWQEVRIIMAQSRNPQVSLEELQQADRIAILGGRPETLAWTAELIARLGEPRRVFLCEDLTLPGEQVREVSAAGLKGLAVSNRAIILIISQQAFA